MIVGLSGKKRSGKDTTADYLVYRYNFKRLSFAQPLKEAAKLIFGWTEEHVNGSLKEIVDPYWKFSPRFALQTMGHVFRKKICSDIWVKSVERLLLTDNNFVITDVRYPNEAKLIHSVNGVLLRVNRQKSSRLYKLKSKLLDHASETALDQYSKFDCVINNTGSIKDLHSKVDFILKSMGVEEL